MADDNDDSDLTSGLDETMGGKKKNGLKAIIPGLLKWILIGLGAVILIVSIVVITVKIMGPKSSAPSFPASEQFTEKREYYDWYTSLDQIRTTSSDPIPASVVVQVNLGYKKDDKAASAEITARRIEIISFLRQFFSMQSTADLAPQNETYLAQSIRDRINDDILCDSRIRDVRFTELNVVQQY